MVTKVQFNVSVSCELGSFAAGQITEVPTNVAQSWVKGNFVRLVGALPPPVQVEVVPPPVAEVPAAPAPVPAVAPKRAARRK